jgi:hypothetical protein
MIVASATVTTYPVERANAILRMAGGEVIFRRVFVARFRQGVYDEKVPNAPIASPRAGSSP